MLRALHFFEENQRVLLQSEALSRQDFETFRKLVLSSGHSSFEYLQNVYSNSDIRSQGVSLALAWLKAFWRVRGPGASMAADSAAPPRILCRIPC